MWNEVRFLYVYDKHLSITSPHCLTLLPSSLMSIYRPCDSQVGVCPTNLWHHVGRARGPGLGAFTDQRDSRSSLASSWQNLAIKTGQLFPHVWEALFFLQDTGLGWSSTSMDHSKHWQCVLAGSRWDVTHHEHRSTARTKRAFAIRIKLHSSHSIHWSLQSCKTLNFKCIKQLF